MDQPAVYLARPAVHADGGRRRRHLGSDPRHTKGEVRLARGDQHDHAELHRHRAGQLFHAVLLQDPGRPDHADAPRSAKPLTFRSISQYHSGHAGFRAAERRVSARDTDVRSRLRFSLEDEMGLRAACRRRKSVGGGIRRHLAEKADHHRDDDLGRAGRNGRDRRSAWVSVSLLRRLFGRTGDFWASRSHCSDEIIRSAFSSPRYFLRC